MGSFKINKYYKWQISQMTRTLSMALLKKKKLSASKPSRPSTRTEVVRSMRRAQNRVGNDGAENHGGRDLQNDRRGRCKQHRRDRLQTIQAGDRRVEKDTELVERARYYGCLCLHGW